MSARDEMKLPEGFTCADCFAFRRFCEPMGIAKEQSKRCDWAPSRFRLSGSRLAEYAAMRERTAQEHAKGLSA